ncbi:LysR substrate-binding domain-containing protein [Pararhodobacter sp.]|uniref:LysR substrate-binding domain-containing protein n=1 Tax=Pararhodobacter sp. TaxID=2127056 RepID=UPI002FDEC10E
MLNIRQIEVFKCIMEAGSITEAARRLHVSQPSVSKHLSLLEARLRLQLFERTGNKLVPRPEALALHNQIEQVYSGLDKLNGFMADLAQNRHGEVLIAAMPLLAHRWLPRVLAPFLKQHPGISASLPVRSSQWVNQWVAAGRVDLGIGMGDDEPGVNRESLMTLPLVAVMSADHPLASPHPLERQALSGQSLISLSNFDYSPRLFDNLLSAPDITPGRRIQTFTTYVACELARHGLGVALVDALTALEFREAGLHIRPLTDAPRIEICLLSASHWPRSTLTERLMDMIRENAQTTMKSLDALIAE